MSFAVLWQGLLRYIVTSSEANEKKKTSLQFPCLYVLVDFLSTNYENCCSE